MRISEKWALEEEIERFTNVLQNEVSFVSASKARAIFLNCLGYDSLECLISDLPLTLNENTKVEYSPLSKSGVLCSLTFTANKTNYFPFLLDPLKESNKDVVKTLRKCLSGLYNVHNEHLEVVGEKVGYHVANFILEGDISGASDLLEMIHSLPSDQRKNALLTQAVNRLKLSYAKDANLSTFFSLLPRTNIV